MNEMLDEPKNLRLKNAEEILFLTNVESFLNYKDADEAMYKKIGNFIFDLENYKKVYPSLEKFIWELWAYGFDSIPYEGQNPFEDESFEEKVKMIDLLLSTHYF